jgi:uncharacterized membrane protein YwzB
MSEKPTLDFLENKDGPRTCAVGTVLLMLALACAIALALSPITPSSYVQANISMMEVILLILFALGGGYLVSNGLLFILRDSRSADSITQD